MRRLQAGEGRYRCVDLSELTSQRKAASGLAAIGVVGLALPWFEIYGRPRSAIEMILGTGDLAQHATSELLAIWAAILGLVAVAELAGLYLALSPAIGRPDRPRWMLVAGSAALLICLLLLVLGFRMGVGYWASTVGALALVGVGGRETFS